MNTLLVAGVLIVAAILISIVIFALSRKTRDPITNLTPKDRWTVVHGKGHNGDDIENIKGVTVDDAKIKCATTTGCKGFFFYDRNKETGKGNAWLKKHAHEPYADYNPDASTYLYD